MLRSLVGSEMCIRDRGEAMYKDQQAAGGAAGAEQPQSDNQQEAPKDDDVIDADYEEVDEDKKASGQ